MDVKNISFSDLQVKRKELEAIATEARARFEDAEQKIKSIDDVMALFDNKSSQLALVSDSMGILPIKDIIIQILKERGKPMEKNEIYRESIRRGGKVSPDGFNTRISELSRDPNSSVERIAKGVYEFKV